MKYKQRLHIEKFGYGNVFSTFQQRKMSFEFFTILNVREYIIYQNKRKLECIAHVHIFTILRDMWCLEDILCYTWCWVGEVFGGMSDLGFVLGYCCALWGSCCCCEGMEHGTIKTQNPKCRLYWCLVEFIDWRYSQSCWYFRPL